ncbi:MAG TPA: sigma-70 family RNA polymerase sigma factor [Puia sp.]|nr:sigma-70 family RNA polymerase sigma factor [Puia sp.]
MKVALDKEAQLLQKIADGDELAFKQLFLAFWPQVYGTSFRLTKNTEHAKDLSQEIFIKLWNYRESLPEVRHLQAFIYTVSRHLIINFIRKKILTEANIDHLLDHIEQGAVDSQKDLEYKELQALMDHAIETLPEKIKQVFTLHRLEGLTHHQIAARLGITVTSSKTYIVRALRHIKEFLEKNSETILLIIVVLMTHH